MVAPMIAGRSGSEAGPLAMPAMKMPSAARRVKARVWLGVVGWAASGRWWRKRSMRANAASCVPRKLRASISAVRAVAQVKGARMAAGPTTIDQRQPNQRPAKRSERMAESVAQVARAARAAASDSPNASEVEPMSHWTPGGLRR
jgi:hypothetical protein